MKYTAKLGRNLRYMSASQTMVLMRGIIGSEEEFRDHAWVELSKELDKILHNKLFNRNSAIIEFEADTKRYPDHRNGGTKETLINIRSIKILGRA